MRTWEIESLREQYEAYKRANKRTEKLRKELDRARQISESLYETYRKRLEESEQNNER